MIKFIKPLKISFCTTCMNRTNYLKKTLPINLHQVRDNIEFVVLNYSSKDDLDDWIKPYVENNRVNYYKLEGKEHFHMAHAKNVACKLATGDIVVNLDADMIIGKNFNYHLLKLFRNPNTTIACGQWFVSGKIATTKKCFWDLQGYDERMMGWGAEDFDFVNRSKLYGNEFTQIYSDEFNICIGHNNEIRTKNYDEKFNKMHETEQANYLIACHNHRFNVLTPNNGNWGKATLIKNYSELVEI